MEAKKQMDDPPDDPPRLFRLDFVIFRVSQLPEAIEREIVRVRFQERVGLPSTSNQREEKIVVQREKPMVERKPHRATNPVHYFEHCDSFARNVRHGRIPCSDIVHIHGSHDDPT